MNTVDPEVKVTYMKGIRKWIVRTTFKGEVWMEEAVDCRTKIGREARSQLRMFDKCGGSSLYADRARHRETEKALKRSSNKA